MTSSGSSPTTSSGSSPTNPEILSPNYSPMNPNSNSPISSISSITIQNISCMVPTKLKRDNYLVWKSLFTPIFRRYKLTRILDGTEVCPPPYLLDNSGHNTSVSNPSFEAWYENDQNILIWFLSLLVFPFLVNCGSILNNASVESLLRTFINFMLVFIQFKKVILQSEYIQQIKVSRML